MSKYAWLPDWLVQEAHDAQITEHGGAAGTRDDSLFESALARPVNAHAYGVEDVCELAALYAAGIIKNHPFVDGNKRTGFILSELFLNLNGIWLDASNEAVTASVLMLAGGEWTDKEYAVWLREHSREAS